MRIGFLENSSAMFSMTERPGTTAYFREQVLRKRSYLKVECCQAVIANPEHCERQGDGRIRFWGSVEELPGKILRVVTLEDGETIHNASRTVGTEGEDDEAELRRGD